MRTYFLFILLTVIFSSHLRAQQWKNGAEINFSLIHPAKWSLTEYEYSVDPTLEVCYFTSISKNYLISAGVSVQTGKHQWLEYTGHTFTDKDGIPFPVRTDYSRQLNFTSLGIPLKLERMCRNSFIQSFYVGLTGGKHLNIEMADYLKSTYVADLEPGYNRFFWELNFGLRKNVYKTKGLQVTLSPETGFRKNSPDKSIGGDNYIYYGFGISTFIGK